MTEEERDALLIICRDKLIVYVQEHWLNIQYIDNPSEEVQLAAVTKWGYAIQFIENPSEAVQLAAVTKNGWAIGYIKNPSERVRVLAELCKVHSWQTQP